MALDAQWSAVARGYRFTLIAAGVLGIAALAACALSGYPLAGLFICVGLGLGSWNSRRLWTDTEKLVDTSRTESPAGEDGTSLTTVVKWRGDAATSTARRLGLITLIAFLVAVAYRPLGWTVFLGLVAFQLLLMALLAAPLRKVVRP